MDQTDREEWSTEERVDEVVKRQLKWIRQSKEGSGVVSSVKWIRVD